MRYTNQSGDIIHMTVKTQNVGRHIRSVEAKAVEVSAVAIGTVKQIGMMRAYFGREAELEFDADESGEPQIIGLTLDGIAQASIGIRKAEDGMWNENGSVVCDDVLAGHDPDTITTNPTHDPLGYDMNLGYVD